MLQVAIAMTECLSVLLLGLATVTENAGQRSQLPGRQPSRRQNAEKPPALPADLPSKVWRSSPARCATRHKECGERQRCCAPVWGTAASHGHFWAPVRQRKRQRTHRIHFWTKKARDTLCSRLMSRRRPSQSHADWPKIARDKRNDKGSR